MMHCQLWCECSVSNALPYVCFLNLINNLESQIVIISNLSFIFFKQTCAAFSIKANERIDLCLLFFHFDIYLTLHAFHLGTIGSL